MRSKVEGRGSKALAALLVVEGAALFAASWFGDFAIAGHPRMFVALMWVAGAAFLTGMWLLGRASFSTPRDAGGGLNTEHRTSNIEPRTTPAADPLSPSGFDVVPPPAGRSVLLSPAIFWLVAIVFRLAMLGCTPGDDMWRYLWEGRVQLAGFNPYVHRPDASELAALRDATWPRINHPESPAIYPPAAELALAGIAAISPSVLAFKLVFAAADLLTAFLLLRLTRSFRAAAWYAWNPAVIYAFAGAGHYDSLMLLAITGSLLALERFAGSARPRAVERLGRGERHRLPSALGAPASGRTSNTEHRTSNIECPNGPGLPLPSMFDVRCSMFGVLPLSAAALLGLAIALKLVPIFLLPAWACALGRRAWMLALALLIPAAFIPLYGDVATVFGPLAAFAEVTRFHDLLWWAVEAVTIPNPFGRNWPFTLALAVAVAVAAFRLRHDWRRSALWLMGLTLVLSPVLHPWYATWILPISVWQRAHAWTVLSISALAAFLLWESTPWWTEWQPNLITRSLVLLPALAAWGFSRWKSRHPAPSPDFQSALQSP